MGASVIGRVAPARLKPFPATVAALTVTEAVPVEVKVTDCVAGEFRLTSPNAMLEALTVSLGTPTFSCKANDCVAPPAVAVSVTVVAVVTEDAAAVKLALNAPAATVTKAGTVTAELLLARLTANPPVAAAAFRETVQLSVPAPVTDPLLQLIPLNTGTSVPLKLMAVDAPVDELLVSVNVPEAAPAVVGSNCTVSVAV